MKTMLMLLDCFNMSSCHDGNDALGSLANPDMVGLFDKLFHAWPPTCNQGSSAVGMIFGSVNAL